MYGLSVRRVDPQLKQIVSEASRALTLLDADRLEELATACEALDRDHLDRALAARQTHDLAHGMAVFARVLDATRANLEVMNRLRAIRQGGMFYEPSTLDCGGGPLQEPGDGHN